MHENHKSDPLHQVKIAPKLEKSPERDHNPSSCAGGQDTTACYT